MSAPGPYTPLLRGTCRWCGNQFTANDSRGYPARSLRLGRIDPKAYFCTMECATRYAVAIVNHVTAGTVKRTPAVESAAMGNHPNRGWRGKWTVDQANQEARHGPSGLVVRFPGARMINGEEVLRGLQERHGDESRRMLARLVLEANRIYEERGNGS